MKSYQHLATALALTALAACVSDRIVSVRKAGGGVKTCDDAGTCTPDPGCSGSGCLDDGGATTSTRGAGGHAGRSSTSSGAGGSSVEPNDAGEAGGTTGKGGSGASDDGGASGFVGAGGSAGADTGGRSGTGGASDGGRIGAGGTGAGGTGAGGTGTGGAGVGGAIVLGPNPTAATAAAKGPCAVQTYTNGVATGPDYTSPTVYFPTDCTAPFPGVVIIPGFTATQSSMIQWGTFLASHGFVVMLIDTASGGTANTSIQPAQRADSLIEALTTLKNENTRSGSPLSGKLETSRMALMGHSMGGGGVLIAANTHPELKAVVALNPWGGTSSMITVPSLLFGGSADTIAPPSMLASEYDAIPATTTKVYAELSGGSHLVATTPLGGAATDTEVARLGLSWLEVYVVGDGRYRPFIATTSAMSAWKSAP